MDDPNENPDDPPILELLQGRKSHTKQFRTFYIFHERSRSCQKVPTGFISDLNQDYRNYVEWSPSAYPGLFLFDKDLLTSFSARNLQIAFFKRFATICCCKQLEHLTGIDWYKNDFTLSGSSWIKSTDKVTYSWFYKYIEIINYKESSNKAARVKWYLMRIRHVRHGWFFTNILREILCGYLISYKLYQNLYDGTFLK